MIAVDQLLLAEVEELPRRRSGSAVRVVGQAPSVPKISY